MVNELVSSYLFPILKRKMHGDKRLVYLDSGATTQKPLSVIRAMSDFYSNYNANVHRGIYQLSAEATIAYEKSHSNVASFINADSMEEIVFTRNTSDSLNILARMLESEISGGDEIVLSQIEHHSNLIPWQQLALRKKALVKFIPLDVDSGLLDLSRLDEIITSKTKLVCITHVSNVLGLIVDLDKVVRRAREVNAKVIVDGAQAVAHIPVDVKKLGVDFYCFSGHKMYGPTGIGVLFGKREHLENLSPVSFGGEMVSRVSFEDADWASLPWKFEAGTPPVAEAVGLSSAVDFLKSIGMRNVFLHEQKLTKLMLDSLSSIAGLTVFGPSFEKKTGIASFVLDGIHSHDLATLLDQDGVCVRAGHHCAMPLMQLLNVPASVRASLGIHNTEDDIGCLIGGLNNAKKIFDG